MEFHNISWKWCDFTQFSAPWGGNGALAAPGREHQRNHCFSYIFLGILGGKGAFRGGPSQKTHILILLWISPKWLKFRGIPPFSTYFQLWGVPCGSGPPEGVGIANIIKGFARHAGDRRIHWFHTLHHNFTGLHRESWIYMFPSLFCDFSWNHM